MATHPADPPGPVEQPEDTGAPNPTHLPVEPEFGPMPPAAEPEDPTVHRPAI